MGLRKWGTGGKGEVGWGWGRRMGGGLQLEVGMGGCMVGANKVVT